MTKLKFFLVLNFLGSCSTLNTSEMASILYSPFASNDIEVTQPYFKNAPYSFAKLNIGRDSIIIVLSNIDNGLHEWVSSEGVRIFTFKGKIVRTIGLTYDISVTNFKSFRLEDDHAILATSFYGPDLSSLMESTVTKSSSEQSIYMGNSIKSTTYKERVTNPRIRFYGDNMYLLADNGFVFRSEQKIHPFIPRIKIEYFYKF